MTNGIGGKEHGNKARRISKEPKKAAKNKPARKPKESAPDKRAGK